MASKAISDGIVMSGLGIIGYVHEFVISNKAELLPIIIFGLLVIKGVQKIFGKD